MVKLSIITISTNELHFFKKFYQSLKKYEPNNNYEIILIDNASQDKTSEWCSKYAPDVVVVKNKKKQGFAFNNNVGIKRSTGKYVLIINPDIIFIEPFIEKTTQFLDNNSDIGLLHVKLLNRDLTLQYSARRFYTYPTLIVRRLPFFRSTLKNSKLNRIHLYMDKNFNKIFYPDWVIGAFMMMPREIINKVGFLDERFTLYFEDVDYCKKIWKSNYKVVYFPYVKMVHLYNRESDTRKFFDGFKLRKGTKIHFESMMKYLKKHSFKLGQ